MAIYVTGDTHGEYSRLVELDRKLKENDYVIVCGDFGYIFFDDYSERKLLDDIEARPYTLLFVDGNHENFNAINEYPEEIWNGGKIHRIRNNIIHLCRGQVFNIEGTTFFTMGGGYSLDKYMRHENISWWKQEMPTDEDFEEGNRNLARYDNKVDYIITHTAPERVIKSFDYKDTSHEKPLNNYLQHIYDMVDFKHWYCGHLHSNEDIFEDFSVLWFGMRKIS